MLVIWFRLFEFMGDPAANQQGPFNIHYRFENETQVGPFIPLNPKTTSCHLQINVSKS